MSTSTAENNKRIAKNTLILYVRMLFCMIISLYTSRVLLDTLGISDYGVFNVVGGIVVMMNVLNSAMTSSTQRYLTFELGKQDYKQFGKTFSMCMNIFLCLSGLIIILGETVGLWFVNTYLVIPPDRIVAANWVYQFALLTCVSSMLATPYNATIVSHERMNIYAYVGVYEVVMKLVIVYLLLLIPFDKLAFYGALTFLNSFLITLIYRYYCKRQFKETHYLFYWDKNLFKRLASYSGWNLFGSLAGVAKGQGLNVLINIFFDPSVNASRGIAYQVNGVILSFFNNFFMAVRPQITKYYAQGNKEEMFKLVFNSSKMSFFLILLVSLPLVIEAPAIIQFWLGQTPDYVVVFVRLIIIITTIDSMSTPLITALHATGDNRLYQLTVGLIIIMTLPISYIFLKSGYSPVSVFIVSLVMTIISMLARLLIAKKQLGISFTGYITQVVLRSFIVAFLAAVLPVWIHIALLPSWYTTIIVCAVCMLSSMSLAFFGGFDYKERRKVLAFVKSKIIKSKK